MYKVTRIFYTKLQTKAVKYYEFAESAIGNSVTSTDLLVLGIYVQSSGVSYNVDCLQVLLTRFQSN